LSIIEEACKELPTLKGKKEEKVLTSAAETKSLNEKNVHIGVDN